MLIQRLEPQPYIRGFLFFLQQPNMPTQRLETSPSPTEKSIRTEGVYLPPLTAKFANAADGNEPQMFKGSLPYESNLQ